MFSIVRAVVTAVCFSIDRILQNTVPICCLSFDGSGIRHPGMTHGAGGRSPARSTFPLSCHPQKPRAYPPREPRPTNNTSYRKANGEIRFLACWRSMCGGADAGMPGCRTPIRSKGKQRVGAVSCGIRSIETQTAVRVNLVGYVNGDCNVSWSSPASHWPLVAVPYPVVPIEGLHLRPNAS